MSDVLLPPDPNRREPRREIWVALVVLLMFGAYLAGRFHAEIVSLTRGGGSVASLTSVVAVAQRAAENVMQNAPPVEMTAVELYPPVELDFLTKDEVLEMRVARVNRVRNLAPQNYAPAPEIFQAIGDKKGWWGMYGLYGLGPGETGIAGPSEESRFLENPYLLVGLCEPHGWKGMSAPDPSASFAPVPLQLVYHSRSNASVRYNVSDHFSYLVQNNFADAHKRVLNMIAYNARDFGLNYLAVDTSASLNVVWKNTLPEAVLIRQMIHVGSSCGYEGGCNNGSPDQPELSIEVPEVPARAVIRLWRRPPASLSVPADMTFTIEMI